MWLIKMLVERIRFFLHWGSNKLSLCSVFSAHSLFILPFLTTAQKHVRHTISLSSGEAEPGCAVCVFILQRLTASPHLCLCILSLLQLEFSEILNRQL